MTAEPLRQLLTQYSEIVFKLNEAIDISTQRTNESSIAKATVLKLQHQKDLIKEQIMSEKKLINIE